MARQARRIGVEIDADVEQRKFIIFQEAARAFAENGVQHTSVNDIAKRLNVAKPSVYHYVSSKEEMIDEVLNIAAEQVEELIQAADEVGPTALHKLCFILRQMTRDADNPFSQCLARIDVLSLPPEKGKVHSDIHRKMQNRVGAIIKEGIDDGSIRPCNPTVQAFLTLGAAQNVCRWYRAGGRQSLAVIAEQVVESITHGIAVG